MKRYLILGCLLLLSIAGLVSSTTFIVLYISSQNELGSKTSELNMCINERDTTPSCNDEVLTDSEIKTVQFKDDGQDISITYPLAWQGALTTEISSDFVYDPVYGRVITKYEYNLTKSGVTLKFLKLIGAVDGFPLGLKSTDSDWVQVSGTNIVRYSNKGENDWKYVEILDCSEMAGPFFTEEEISSFDLCVGSFFPGFGSLGANSLTIKTSNAQILQESDLIAKSALN